MFSQKQTQGALGSQDLAGGTTWGHVTRIPILGYVKTPRNSLHGHQFKFWCDCVILGRSFYLLGLSFSTCEMGWHCLLWIALDSKEK
jgi:hypothetical protein